MLHIYYVSKSTKICEFVYVFIHLCVSRLLAKLNTIQNWNLAHILPLTLSENWFFRFFDQITVTAASLKKLPCHVDFPHISSIALFFTFPATKKHVPETLRENVFQNPREANSRSRIFLISLAYVCMYVFMRVTPPGQTKNDTDLKFGTHTSIDLF